MLVVEQLLVVEVWEALLVSLQVLVELEVFSLLLVEVELLVAQVSDKVEVVVHLLIYFVFFVHV